MPRVMVPTLEKFVELMTTGIAHPVMKLQKDSAGPSGYSVIIRRGYDSILYVWEDANESNSK